MNESSKKDCQLTILKRELVATVVFGRTVFWEREFDTLRIVVREGLGVLAFSSRLFYEMEVGASLCGEVDIVVAVGVVSALV